MPTPTRSFRPRLTPLEDRTTPADLTQTGSTLTVDLNSSGEVVTFTTTAAGIITVDSTAGIILNGGSTSPPVNLANVTLVLVTDSAAATGVDFSTSTVPYEATFVVTLDNTPQAVNFVGSSAFATNSLTVTTTNHIGATGAVSTTTGNLTLSANQQATPTSGLFYGIELLEATVSSTTGVITLTGRGGDDSDGQNFGVYLHGSFSPTSVVGGTVIISGTGGASLGQSNHGVFHTLSSTISSSGNGSVVVTGVGGGTGTSLGNIGVLVSADANITAGGVGSVVVTGSGGAGTSGGHVGVSVTGSGSQVTSGGGSVDVTGSGGSSGAGNVGVAVGAAGVVGSAGLLNVTGAGGNGAFGLTVATGGQVASGAGPLTVTADTIDLDASATVAAVGDSQSATIRPLTAGTLIDLGGADVLTGSPLALGLTDAELDRVSARGLTLGRSNAGALTVTAPLTRPSITDLQLVSGGDIVFGGGGVDTGGGTLTVSPNTGFTPDFAGPDATASSVSFAGGSVLNVAVAGTTPDTQYVQLNVSGAVDLSGLSLSLTGTYVPAAGDTFTIVSATSVSGTLTGLANGAAVTFNGVVLRVVYTTTAVVLRVNSAPANLSAGGPYTVAEGSGLTVSAPAATDADGDTLSYTWDVNGDGTFGDETAGTVTDGGRTVAYTGAQLATLGLNDGPRTVNTLAVRASDVFTATTTAFGTLTITNAAPTVTSFVVPSAGTEGSAVSVSATATDPAGANDPLAFAWVVLKNGSPFAASTAAAFTFTPDDDGTYAVSLTVTDGDGGSATDSRTLTVSNVAPSITPSGAGVADEGAVYTLTLGPVSDPGTDTVTAYRVNWGDGTSDVSTTAGVKTHTYADDGVYTVSVDLTDEDGPFTNVGSAHTVAVSNIVPAVTPPASVPSPDEGMTTAFDLGSFTDPAGANDGPYTVVVFWGDGSSDTFTSAVPAALPLVSHTYADNGNYTVLVTVSEAGGTPTGSAPFGVTVNNVAPTPTVSGPTAGTEGSPLAFTATATDPAGANDPLAFAWVVSLGGVTVASGSGASFAFTPAVGGTYTVAVTVSDGDGGVASSSANVLVPPPPVLPPVFVAPPLAFSNAGRVRVVYPDGGTRDLEPFPGFLGDVSVASADMNADGFAEVIVGAGRGGGPHVVVFDGLTGAVTASFFAYDVRFSGGVYVAATTDGRIITGAGAFGGPHVKVIAYSRTGQKLANGQIADTALVTTFFAYDVRFTGGVRVAAADVTGDGVADIVTGAGPGGGPHVKAFDGVTAGEVRSFFAFAPEFTGGVHVAAAAGGWIAVGADTWGGPHVKAFDATGGVRLNTFAYPVDFVGGVRVALADVDPDGVPEVVTAPGLGGGQVVKAFRLSDSASVLSLAPFDPLDPLGIFVG